VTNVQTVFGLTFKNRIMRIPVRVYFVYSYKWEILCWKISSWKYVCFC